MIEQGLADQNGHTIRYQRNLLRMLMQRDVVSAGDKLARETGLAFVELKNGDRIEGVYRTPVHLASGKFAVIEKSKEFSPVPWRQVLERHRGKMLGAIVRGSSVWFEIGKKRGMGVG